MGKLLKKMNRGVALGVVLLIGLIVFFIMDSAAFAKEEPELKDFLDEYMRECAKINLLPEQYRQSGADIPEDVIEAKVKEGKEFVEKYFTDYKKGDYYSTKEAILSGIESMYKENRNAGYTIEDFKYSLISIQSINKQSADAVRIRFTANLNMLASTDARYVNLTNIDWGFRRGELTGTKDVENTLAEHTFTILLFKVDGEWKIAHSEGYFTNVSRTVVVNN